MKFLCIFLLPLVSCVPSSNSRCTDDSDCPDGYACSASRCMPKDAGVGIRDSGFDSSTIDVAAGMDALASDAPAADNTANDLAAAPDSILPDAASDGSLPDAYSSDTAPLVDAAPACSPACANNETCQIADGGVAFCVCGDRECTGNEACRSPHISSTGPSAPVCCEDATDIINCAGSCVDRSGDENNCGVCNRACGLTAPTCFNGQCGCESSAVCTDDLQNTVPRCMTDGGVVESVDGGGHGQCNYELCSDGFGDCTSVDGCETNLLVSLEHCGVCDRPAESTNDAGVPISNICADGEPVCGSGECTGEQVCFLASGDPPGNSECVDCFENSHCSGQDHFCCNRTCTPINQADNKCGCGPLDADGDHCSNGYNPADLGQVGAVQGAICIDPLNSGAEVTADTVHRGQCGCNPALAFDSTYCGSVSYDNDSEFSRVQLAALCNPKSYSCVNQNRSNCGQLGGVTPPFPAMSLETQGLTCNSTLGGPNCEDNRPETLLGECGCLLAGDKSDRLCATPVEPTMEELAAGGRRHTVADNCNRQGYCECDFNSVANRPCDIAGSSPDCCVAGCVDLDESHTNCGLCGTLCGSPLGSGDPDMCGQTTNRVDRGQLGASGQCGCSNEIPAVHCPVTGGGGGPSCVDGWCTCSSAHPIDHIACATTYHCIWLSDEDDGDGVGCCENPPVSEVNRCPQSRICSDLPTTPVLCVNRKATGTKWACCGPEERCGLLGEDVACLPN